jgi:hypothetical protein
MMSPVGAPLSVDLSARGHGADIVGRWIDPYVAEQTRECEDAIGSLRAQ